MISISANPENSPRRVRDELGLYSQYLGVLTFNCMKHEAALCALGFVRFTPPFAIRESSSEKGTSGIGKDDEKVGNAAVASDIRSIFRPTDSDLRGSVDPAYGSIETFQKWKRRPMPRGSDSIIVAIWKDQNIERAYDKARNYMESRPSQRLIDSPSQMNTIHEEQRRAYRGRIRRNRGPSQDIKKSAFLVDTPIINKYIALRQKQVGWLKSAWADVIRTIGRVNLNGKMINPAGGTNINQWIKRHGKGGGGFIRTHQNRKQVTIVNKVGDNDTVASTANVIETVISWRHLCLNRRDFYQHEVDKSIALWNAGRIKAWEKRIYGN